MVVPGIPGRNCVPATMSDRLKPVQTLGLASRDRVYNHVCVVHGSMYSAREELYHILLVANEVLHHALQC